MDGQKPEDGQTPTQFAPGDTVRPQQQAAPSSSPLPPVVVSEQESAAVNTQPQISQPSMPAPQQAAPEAPFDPTIYDTSFRSADSQPGDDTVSWTASEFIAHQKNSSWYTLLILGSIVVAALTWFVTKDIVSAVVIMFVAIIFATYAGREPRQLSYRVDPSGLTIDQKHYDYSQFRSFSVVPEGAFLSVVFAPLKRFGTLITVYFDPNDEAKIVDAISTRLPHEERRPDAIDGLMHRIRF